MQRLGEPQSRSGQFRGDNKLTHVPRFELRTLSLVDRGIVTVLTQLTQFLLYVEIKRQLDATEVFIADLIACSTCFGHHYAHHQERKSITQWLLPVVFRAVIFKLLVWCGAEGYVSGLQDATASCKPDTDQTRNLKTTARNTTGSNHCVILLSS